MPRKLLAESIGTFVLVFGGCGSAIFGGVVGGLLGRHLDGAPDA